MRINVLSDQVETISLLSSGEAALMTNSPRGIQKREEKIKIPSSLKIIVNNCH